VDLTYKHPRQNSGHSKFPAHAISRGIAARTHYIKEHAEGIGAHGGLFAEYFSVVQHNNRKIKGTRRRNVQKTITLPSRVTLITLSRRTKLEQYFSKENFMPASTRRRVRAWANSSEKKSTKCQARINYALRRFALKLSRKTRAATRLCWS